MSTQVRVTIGLPVYNGARYMRQAIDSILNQSFRELELLIGDNASTDATSYICREYERRDPRVRYLRSDTNRGPAWNYNRLLPEARGEYFKWAAADDVCAPTLVERCVEVLDRDPTAVAAFPDTVLINGDGVVIRANDFYLEVDAARPSRRFAALVLANHRRHGAYESFAVYRTDALRQTPLFEPYARGDSVLLARCALLGRYVRVPEPLFLNRDHGGRSVRSKPTGRARSPLAKWIGVGPLPPPEWWDPALRDKIVFPEWNLIRQYTRSIWMTPLCASERLRCVGVIVQWCVRNPLKLLRDLLYAAEQIGSALRGTSQRQDRPLRARPHFAHRRLHG